MKKTLFLIFLLLIGLSAAHAQNLSEQPDSLNASLVIVYPGAEIYELEGHAALRLQGAMDGNRFDWAVNWGIFDFNSPNFAYRFVKGETDYMVAATPWPFFLNGYIHQGRRVVEYLVPLDSIQSTRLMQLVADNLKPENRVYRYNYVYDNCSTRPLRMIEKAIGDSIVLRQPSNEASADNTFRQVMQRYHKNYPWYQLGIDIALGGGIDKPITAREKSFAPIVLDAQLAEATVGNRSLTSDAIVIFDGEDVVLPPTPWYLAPITVFWALFAIVLAVTVADLRRRRVSRWLDALLFTGYGIAGCVVTFLVFVSVHEASSPNWLLCWLNPLCFIVPVCIWLKKCKKIVFSYQIINFVLILVMLAAWAFTGQYMNAALIPLLCCDMLRAVSYIVISTKKRNNTL